MSNLIYLDAEFRSYAAFEAAFKQYCQQNAVHGVPLSFVVQGGTKLKPDSFKSETLDQATIDTFVYKGRALVCTHRKSSADENQINCHGRVTFRFDKAKKLIVISSFFGQHTNHPNRNVFDRSVFDNFRVQTNQPNQSLVLPGTSHSNRIATQRELKLNTIFELIKKMPDEALKLIEEASEVVLREWGNDNVGVSIAIRAIEKDDIVDSNAVNVRSTDSGSNLQQYLLNRSVLTSDYDAEQRHGMTAEQETFVVDDSSDESDDDDDEGIHPQLMVQAELLEPPVEFIDLTDDSQLLVPLVSVSQDKEKETDLTGTITPIVSFAGTNENDNGIEQEINNNTPIDSYNSQKEHPINDSMEQAPNLEALNEKIDAHALDKSTSEILPLVDQHASIQSDPEHDENSKNDNNDEVHAQQSQNDNNVCGDDYNMTNDDDNIENPKVDKSSLEADSDQQTEPKTNDDIADDDDPMNAGEKDIDMNSEDTIIIDEPMPHKKNDLSDACEVNKHLEHEDEVTSSQVPMKRAKLSEPVTLTRTKSNLGKSSKSLIKRRQKEKFRNLRIKAGTNSEPWQSPELPEILEEDETPKKASTVVYTVKPKPKPKMKTKSKGTPPTTRSKYCLSSKSNKYWLDAFRDEEVFEDEPEPSYKLKKKNKE